MKIFAIDKNDFKNILTCIGLAVNKAMAMNKIDPDCINVSSHSFRAIRIFTQQNLVDRNIHFDPRTRKNVKILLKNCIPCFANILKEYPKLAKPGEIIEEYLNSFIDGFADNAAKDSGFVFTR